MGGTMARTVERSGMLIVRAWVEGPPIGLRARIIQSRDITGRAQIETTTSSVEQVLATVRDWLEALLEGVEAGQRPGAQNRRPGDDP
jgi:hypothetical protein